jgi:hypothetical protein
MAESVVALYFLHREIHAMNVYCVSYDLHKPGQNYEGLFDQLKNSPGWWHYLESTWLIATSETAQDLAKRLFGVIDANDSLLVINARNESAGWLPSKAWDWINRNVPR